MSRCIYGDLYVKRFISFLKVRESMTKIIIMSMFISVVPELHNKVTYLCWGITLEELNKIYHRVAEYSVLAYTHIKVETMYM